MLVDQLEVVKREREEEVFVIREAICDTLGMRTWQTARSKRIFPESKSINIFQVPYFFPPGCIGGTFWRETRLSAASCW